MTLYRDPNADAVDRYEKVRLRPGTPECALAALALGRICRAEGPVRAGAVTYHWDFGAASLCRAWTCRTYALGKREEHSPLRVFKHPAEFHGSLTS